MQETLRSVAEAIETRDGYAVGHQRRVAKLAAAIAHELGLSSNSIDCIYLAAMIHDVSSVRLPPEILRKSTDLTPLEREKIETHVQATYQMVKDIKFPWSVAPTILQHHERLDGSGFPKHLRGDAIMVEARILAVADVVDALTADRFGRPALSLDETLAELQKSKGILYAAAAVDACVTLLLEKGFSFDWMPNTTAGVPTPT